MTTYEQFLEACAKHAEHTNEPKQPTQPRTRKKQQVFTSDNIGDVIKSAREEQGISQVKLAKAVGISEDTMVRIENGRNSPLFSTIVKIAETLGKKVVLK